MKTEFKYPHFDVTHIQNSRLKNITLLIKNTAEVILKSPPTSFTELTYLLDKKRSWVEKRLLALSKIERASFGEEIEYFGKIIPISEISELHIKVKKSHSTIKTQKIIDDFYKKEAKAYIPARLEHFEQMMNLHPKEIKFRKMKRRWGSCSSKKVITFNSYLLKASYEQIDYVIIHELTHLQEMNHSKKFYARLARTMPHHKEVEKSLSKVLL